jgi:hypothetical protein
MMKNADKVIMTIALPDGWWYFKITRYQDDVNGYDYYIPDNRKEEQKIKTDLVNG